MRVGETARVLGIRKDRVRVLVNAGAIRAIGNGPGRRISRESIEKSKLPIQRELPYED